MTIEELAKIVGQLQKSVDELNKQHKNHRHSGLDGKKLKGNSLENAPQSALTGANTNTLSSGGTAVLSNTDSGIISNVQTRQNEIITRLQNLGLIQ